jgi:hypothetical protein
MGKEDLSDNYQLVNLAYAIVHELVHEGMDSGNPYSDWNEGLTDFIARDIMKIVKRGIFGREQSTRNDRMIELTVPSRSDGIEVDASDAVFYTPGRGAIPYSRFLETYPIKRFRKDAPNAYRALLRDHFRGTDLAVEERLVARAA